MKRSRLVALLLLCLLVLASGCQYLPKSMTSLLQPQRDEISSWLASIATLSPEKQGLAAAKTWQDASASTALRERALSVMASRPGAKASKARNELAQLYSRALISKRASLESAYWADLDGMGLASLRAAASAVTASQETRFPWNLLLLKAARQGFISDTERISRISAPELYANPALLGLKTAAPAPQGNAVYAALVLPLSGSGSTLGHQVATGAAAAVDMLQSRGVSADIRTIDASAADWTSKIQALPPTYTVIGGLLSANQILPFKNAAAGRAPFAFAATLPTGVSEGSDVWRFFASPEDQVSLLLDAAGSLGIRSAGMFSPEDSYSKRMNAIFQREAEKRGIAVTLGTYDATNLSSWTKSATAFLKTRLGKERGSIPEATAGFEAIFLPDSWKNMDMLISSLHYGGAHNMLMMGTSLWEQSLGNASRNNAATFSLTVFPAAWNGNSTAPGAEAFRTAISARGGHADDWSSLGFDFVQTAAALKLAPGWTGSGLNSKLASLRVDWAGAPLSWDSGGKARRALFLMRPAAVGREAVDAASLRSRYENGPETPPSAPVQETPASTAQSLEELLESITPNPE